MKHCIHQTRFTRAASSTSGRAKKQILISQLKLSLFIALATAGWLVFATGAAAGITSYLNQPDWLAAAGGTNSLTVFSFQGPTESGGKFANDPTIVPSYASQGVVFLPFTGTAVYPVTTRGQQYQISAPNHDGLMANSSCPNPTSDLEGRAIKFDFNIPARSVGVNFNGPILGGDYGYLEAFDTFGNLIGQTPACVAGGFVGLVSDAPVTEVHVVNTGNADITFGIWDLQFVSAFGVSCVAPPVGLVSWWPGDGTAQDLVGGNNGTLTNGAVFVPGKVSQAFHFNAIDSAVTVGYAPNLQLQDFTIEAWIQRASADILTLDPAAAYANGEIFGFGRGGYVFGLNTNSSIFLSKSEIDEVAASPAVMDTNWHHVAVTKSGSTVTFYVDGAGLPQVTYNSVFEFSTPAAIAAQGDNLGGSFLGNIDELAIYNRALTAAEIQSIYTVGSLGKCKPLTILPQGSGAGFNFGFQSVSNQSYTIQRNDDLTTANWIFYTNFTGNGSLMQLVAPVTNTPHRFFRVRQP